METLAVLLEGYLALTLLAVGFAFIGKSVFGWKPGFVAKRMLWGPVYFVLNGIHSAFMGILVWMLGPVAAPLGLVKKRKKGKKGKKKAEGH